MRGFELLSHRRRVLSALLDGRSDALPIVSVNQAATAEVMKRTGIGWPQAHMDPEKMANLAVQTQIYLGFENVRVPFDQTVEAEALGARLQYGGELDFPEVSQSSYSDALELKADENTLSNGRIPVVLDAISRVRHHPQCEAPIVSGIVGPFSVIAQRFGLEKCLRWTVKSPDDVERAMENITPFLISYANEQVKKGADIVSIEDMASSPDLLNPRFFNERASKYLGILIDSIDAPVVLHICGNATRILEKMVELAPAAIHIDVGTDLSKAKYVSEGKVKLAGNLSPVATLLRGKEEDVRRAVIRAVREGIDLVSPGCSLSPLTPSANISSMVQAARELESARDARVDRAGNGLEAVSVNYEVVRSRHLITPEVPDVHEQVEPILAELARAVVEGNLDEVQKKTLRALETLEPAHVIRSGLVAGISTVSKMWDRGEYFLPEVILASDAMQAGVKACEEKMQAAYEREGKVVTFVAEGDIHDIGKSIVISFLRASGYDVVDLGKNVADSDVVRAVLKERPLLVCGSALMTTTMSAFPRIAEMLMKNGMEVPLAVGGGAVTQEFAESFPLGVYGERPNDAVLAAELSKEGVSWRDIRRKIADVSSKREEG